MDVLGCPRKDVAVTLSWYRREHRRRRPAPDRRFSAIQSRLSPHADIGEAGGGSDGDEVAVDPAASARARGSPGSEVRMSSAARHTTVASIASAWPLRASSIGPLAQAAIDRHHIGPSE